MKQRNVFVMIILLIVVLVIGSSSYAYLRAESGSNNSNTITLGNLDVMLLTDINNLTLSNALPSTDVVGLNNQGVTFQIKNDSTQMANYKVSLVDGEIRSTMANEYIRYQLKKIDSNNVSETFEIKNLDKSGLLNIGTIDPQEIITFELIMWIDYNTNPNGLNFVKNVLVEGIQATGLDSSGANYPELLDNMIPVYYDATDDTNGVWKVADVKNINSTHKWFDYDNHMWANAVTVKENGTMTRSQYLNASNGTVIALDDITSMWVWIPRFKYTIFNANNNVSEQLIKVEFEHGIDKTGTMTCTDDIQNNSFSSEICIDTTNTNIVNNVSTYTHPAFTLGNEQLIGFWFSKFEMSKDANDNVLIVPNADAIVNQPLGVLFNNARSMELNNNIHGFKQSDLAILSIDGTIANDNNKFDIHLEKNMEWGAVSYLSQSKYGKYGNNLYSGVNKRIYKNNYAYKTGYSGYSEDATNSTVDTVSYNNLINLENGRGYKGAGASTTGTVYGVFDMNGGAYEFTMGNQFSSSNEFFPANSELANLNSKYYDSYSYNDSSSLSRSKFGDAVKETIGWGKYSTENMPFSTSPWFIKGGSADNSNYSGIYYNSNSSGSSNPSITSRPVLAVSREFSWLD